MRKIATAFLGLCAPSAVQILPRVAMYVKTHVMMLHSEFCAACSSLSDVAAKIFLLNNIHLFVTRHLNTWLTMDHDREITDYILPFR